jgi:hypothetical protein
MTRRKSVSFFSVKVPLMLLHYVFLFVLFLLLSPPRATCILAAAQTTTKKSSCPLIGENADITKGNDEEITSESSTKPLRSSCGSDILSSDGACTICASAIDTLILSRIPLTSEELRTFDMKACGAFFIESGASVTTLLGMRKCEREESAAYRALLNEEKGRKQGEGGGEEEEEERRKEDKAGRDPSVLYCFLFFCSFPLLDIGISEKLIPFYFAFVFIISLGVLSVMLCKLFLLRQRQRRRRKEKEITREGDVDSQSPSRLTS